MKNIINTRRYKNNVYLLISYIFLLGLLLKYSGVIGTGVFKVFNAFKILFIGIVIAFIINIPMKSIEKFLKKHIKRNTRAIAIIITYILALILVVLLLNIVIPQLYETITNIVSKADSFGKTYEELALYYKQYSNFNIPINVEDIMTRFADGIGGVASNVTASLSSIVSEAVSFFIGLVVSIYLLASKEHIINQVKKMVGSLVNVEKGNKIISFFRRVNDIFTNYISGILLDAFIIGSLITVMMLILRLPYAILVGVVTTCLAIIPIFGAFMAMIFGAILILAVSPIKTLYFIIGFQVVQQIEGNFIYPKVVGSSVGLPGLWTLLSISVGGILFGFLGMLVAVPITSVIYMVLSDFANKRMNEKNMKINVKGNYVYKQRGASQLTDTQRPLEDINK